MTLVGSTISGRILSFYQWRVEIILVNLAFFSTNLLGYISSGLVNVPEEPIEEEEEEEEEEEDQDMDADDRVVVEYHEELPGLKQPRERSLSRRSSASSSDSDEMDYDLELKMISTPSPKKSMKMTMYADEVESQLKSIR